MEITIDHLTAGAALARGVAVIIDVFRAYSVECYAYHAGAERIYPVGDLDEAYARKRAHPAPRSETFPLVRGQRLKQRQAPEHFQPFV